MFRAATANIGSLARRYMPTRESVHTNRFLKPFAHRLADPALWRMHRRSVPRAVALGLGIGVIIPFMHMVIAAILAVQLRANVALAVAVTFLINPLTMPPLYYAAYRMGAWELGHGSFAAQPLAGHESALLHDTLGPWALGIVTIAIGVSIAGYAASALAWRVRLRVQWARRGRTV